MILPAQVIRRIEPQIIEPWFERTVHNGMTFGLSHAGYDIRCAETVYMPPGSFSLASSIERFTMPLDVLGVVHDKSTWARRGIAIQNTVIEPGWRGHLTLEITNHHHKAVSIYAGDPIAQIIFHRLEEPVKHGYSGKYQDQEAGAQAARMERYGPLGLD